MRNGKSATESIADFLFSPNPGRKKSAHFREFGTFAATFFRLAEICIFDRCGGFRRDAGTLRKIIGTHKKIPDCYANPANKAFLFPAQELFFNCVARQWKGMPSLLPPSLLAGGQIIFEK
jgi:hypothetical protein